MSGTSMSSPLVAGAISALKMVKDYASPEVLISDLAHMDCDFARIFSDEERSTDIYLAGVACNDTITGNKNIDGEVDGGETVELRPIMLNSWSTATDIKLHLDVDSTMAKLVTIDKPDVDFGYSLSPYAHMTSKNPFVVHVTDSLDDGANVKFLLTCSDANKTYTPQEYYMAIKNMVKIGPLIVSKDTTLTAGKTIRVMGDIAIQKGATLTIEPGARLEFDQDVGIKVFGHLVAKGRPESPIIFTKSNYNGDYWGKIEWNDNAKDTLEYCRFFYGMFPQNEQIMNDCEFSHMGGAMKVSGKRCNVRDMANSLFSSLYVCILFSSYHRGKFNRSSWNYVNNTYEYGMMNARYFFPSVSDIKRCNWVNNKYKDDYNGKYYQLSYLSDTISIDHTNQPPYLGTSREDFVRPYCFEFGNGTSTYGTIDLSNILKEPVHEAHGILWKVVVDGKDAQDEFEEMDPLGVGTHKFEVYFNRAMNVNVNPTISYGVRRPFTQHEITGEGTWSADSTIYTINYTLTGRESADGLNRIYVRGAEDNEFFECPYDSTRFNMIIQSAGSMATGFAAEAGLGRVNLTWNNDNNDFSDAMGFNVYRYTMVNDSTSSDTIRLNKQTLDVEATEYTDYAVVPGTTYYYYYKVLSTDLKEYDISNVVACTPKTSELGDANGSGEVDVADVVTTVNYAAGQDPKPFIFEAADMNTDKQIDILDVIGIIRKIISPAETASTSAMATATYTIEDGIVYVDCPVALAGVQVQLATDGKKSITATDDLNGFENTSAWLSDNDYIFLAYNMNGLTLTPGKHSLLNIGDAQISSIRLSDALGHNVEAVGKNVTKIEDITSRMMTTKGVFNINGQKVAADASKLGKLPSGVYIVDGQKVVK